MELFATTGNPIPPGGIVTPVRTSDGRMLRVARWGLAVSRGTILIGMGRSEFIEEYAEIVTALLDRQLEVVIMDWRGQGQSDREIRWTRRGHVSSFSAYRRDLDTVIEKIMKPLAPRPWFALGHSMGAAVLLDQAHDGYSPFERLVLSAPMIDLALRRRVAIRRMVCAVDRLGFGARLIPGGSEASLFLTRPFGENILTSDPRQYERLRLATGELSALAIGAPTIRWLASAFRLMRRFAEPRYPIETLTPILIVAAGNDRIVDTNAVERFAIRLKAGRCITIPGARHQIIMERSDILAQFWTAFDSFVPGERAPAPPPPKRKRKRFRELIGLA